MKDRTGLQFGSTDDGNNSLIGALFVVVLGVAIAGGGYYMYQGQQQAIQEHEGVEATVVSTEIDRDVSRSGQDNKREVTYDAIVTYEYTVDGETYRSSNVRPSGIQKSYDSRSGAEAFLSDYESGQEVTAYHDPEAHDEAFLVQETSNELLFVSGFGALMAVLGIVGVVQKLLGLVALF